MTISRTIPHQIKINPNYFPPGPRSLGQLQTGKNFHQDQYLHGGELSWWGVVRIWFFHNIATISLHSVYLFFYKISLVDSSISLHFAYLFFYNISLVELPISLHFAYIFFYNISLVEILSMSISLHFAYIFFYNISLVETLSISISLYFSNLIAEYYSIGKIK